MTTVSFVDSHDFSVMTNGQSRPNHFNSLHSVIASTIPATSFSDNTFVLHHHLYLSTSFPHHPALPPVSPRTYFLLSMIRNTPSAPPLITHHLILHHKHSPPHYPSISPLLHTLTQAASYTTSTAVTKTHSSLPVLVSGASTIQPLLSHLIMTISSAASLVSNSQTKPLLL